MNIFKNMLFLHGYLVDPREAERDDEALRFAPRYGNRTASERRFAPLGHARARSARRVPEAPAPCGCG